jgi:Hypervirulence associated proteins TUDOR domain
MAETFKRGDHVSWNSEAGRVRGVVLKKVVSNFLFKGYVHQASRREPQYLIRSDKTDYVAIHKGQALTRLRTPSPNKRKTLQERRKRRSK